jgi:hypothetical protein
MVKIFYNIEAPHIEFSSHIFGCKHHFPKHDVVIRSRIRLVWAKQSVTRATTDATAICAHQKSALGAALSESRPSSNKTLYSAYDGTWRPGRHPVGRRSADKPVDHLRARSLAQKQRPNLSAGAIGDETLGKAQLSELSCTIPGSIIPIFPSDPR